MLVVAALWGACGGNDRDHDLAPANPPASCKPEPPISLTIASRPVGGDRYEIAVTATANAALDRLDLALVVPPGAVVDRPERAGFGATARGASRTLIAIVEPHRRSAEISAIARVPVDGIEMAKAATVAVGEPAPVPRTVVYATPDGELAREVRP